MTSRDTDALRRVLARRLPPDATAAEIDAAVEEAIRLAAELELWRPALGPADRP